MKVLALINKIYITFAKIFAIGTINGEDIEIINIPLKIPKSTMLLLEKMYPGQDLIFKCSELISYGIISSSKIEDDIFNKVVDSEGNHHDLSNMEIKGNG